MSDSAPFAPGEWRRLSPWAIAHFAQKAVVQNLQLLVIGGFSAYIGTARMERFTIPWALPLAIIALVLIGSTLTYLFYRYRVVEDAVQVRRGMLFKQHLNLSFQRIQNIGIEHPFYFRPFGLVTLKIDGAGSKGEEVNLAALDLSQAQSLRDFILTKKKLAGPAQETSAATAVADDASAAASEELFFTRSVPDLIVHGLTNNRAFIVVAAVFGYLFQSGISPVDIVRSLGIDFDVAIAGLSLVRLTLLIVLSFIAAIGAMALLSVVVSIFTYYGFTMYRTGDSLTIRRGLLTKHEIHVRKSRIQTIHLRQDWLDRLLGRCNILLERISHSQAQGQAAAAQTRRILVPSVRMREIAIVIDEILPGCHPTELAYTPVSFRYFVKHSIIVSAFYVIAIGVVLNLPPALSWLLAALLVLWPLHMVRTWLRWKAGGLAVEADRLVARSGAIGIDYRLLAMHKVQDVTHIQSLLMRRHDLSSLRLNTASASIHVPHMPSSFIRRVVDYCAFRVESTARSWM